MPVTLTEVGARLGEATSNASRREVTIITAGWGSSGYYSRQLLERDGARAFPVGTHMFLDHPGRAEETDRPERSVRDLAARIATPPRMAGNQLVAEADIFEVWRPVIDSLAEDIGLSIRALGETEHGEAEGRKGAIVTALTEGISVDFVTRAGAGGKVGQLIESARESARESGLAEARNMGNWLEARIHAAFTEIADNMFGNGYLTREERIWLSSAIGDALTAFNATVAENVPGLYGRDPYADPDGVNTQVNEAAGSGRPTKEDIMSDEKRLSELEESVSKLTTRVTEAEAKVTEAERERDVATARADRAEDATRQIRAKQIIGEATTKPDNGDSPVSIYEGLPDRAKARAIDAALNGDLPLTEDGKLDEPKLLERAVSAAKEERDYLTEAGALSDRGRVTGMGANPTATAATAEADTKLAESFKRLGMSDDAAKVAAQGR